MESVLPELAAAVRRRTALDGEVSVELRSTHASWVFMGARDVWKVKRPVALGFLDFSTVDARRRFCEEEVRLNRRLAPDVYLGVEPVHAGRRGLVLGASAPGDPIVDWAVHMRRLPDEASAASLLARGLLTSALLAQLAARMAAFYREARLAPAWGGPAALRTNVDENFAQCERFVGDLVDRATFDQARAFQADWLTAHEGRICARVSAGRIREGHGDLRLEHVYFLPGPGGAPRPLAIDCLEFDERFRCGDVASDVAFLAMELELARRPDLAAGFLARFAEAADDFDLFGVVDFYLSYRAWVRGKVAAFVADDPGAPSPLRSAKRAEARRLFALARSYAGRALDPPFLVCVGGMIGSGKSTLATTLGRALAVPVIGSDLTRKALAGLAPTERGGPELYSEAGRARTYDELLRRAAVVLGAGRAVVLDATFGDRDRRADVARLAARAGVLLVRVEVTCDEDTLRARLTRRAAGASTSDATVAELDELARRYEAPDPAEGAPVVLVDGAQPPGDVAFETLEALAAYNITRAALRRLS